MQRVTVASAKVPLLVGAQGSTVKQIEATYGVKLGIPGKEATAAAKEVGALLTTQK